MSEWLLLNAKWATAQLYQGMLFSMRWWWWQYAFLHKTNTFSWILVALFHCNTVHRSLHSDTLSGYRINQFLLLLLNGECLAEKPPLPNLYVFGLIRLVYNPRSDLPNQRRSRLPMLVQDNDTVISIITITGVLITYICCLLK